MRFINGFFAPIFPFVKPQTTDDEERKSEKTDLIQEMIRNSRRLKETA